MNNKCNKEVNMSKDGSKSNPTSSSSEENDEEMMEQPKDRNGSTEQARPSKLPKYIKIIASQSRPNLITATEPTRNEPQEPQQQDLTHPVIANKVTFYRAAPCQNIPRQEQPSEREPRKEIPCQAPSQVQTNQSVSHVKIPRAVICIKIPFAQSTTQQRQETRQQEIGQEAQPSHRQEMQLRQPCQNSAQPIIELSFSRSGEVRAIKVTRPASTSSRRSLSSSSSASSKSSSSGPSSPSSSNTSGSSSIASSGNESDNAGRNDSGNVSATDSDRISSRAENALNNASSHDSIPSIASTENALDNASSQDSDTTGSRNPLGVATSSSSGVASGSSSSSSNSQQAASSSAPSSSAGNQASNSARALAKEQKLAAMRRNLAELRSRLNALNEAIADLERGAENPVLNDDVPLSADDNSNISNDENQDDDAERDLRQIQEVILSVLKLQEIRNKYKRK